MNSHSRMEELAIIEERSGFIMYLTAYTEDGGVDTEDP